jgi:hypothetical protein
LDLNIALVSFSEKPPPLLLLLLTLFFSAPYSCQSLRGNIESAHLLVEQSQSSLPEDDTGVPAFFHTKCGNAFVETLQQH